jgi:hypothetical protein
MSLSQVPGLGISVSGAREFGKRILPFVYFLIVALPHHPVSDLLDQQVLFPQGHGSMERIANILSLLMLLFMLVLGLRIVRNHGTRALLHLAVPIFLLGLMSVADRTLIVNNIERIHYPQYAMLALLLGLSVRNEMLILFLTSGLGFVDEFMQYAMNPAKTNYLDFNDIVLNTLGAAMGVVLLLGLRKEVTTKPTGYESKLQRVSVSTGAISVAVILFSLALERIAPLVERAKDRSVFAVVDGRLSFIMSFERQEKFWSTSYFGRVFHVLSPFEGVLVLFLLLLFTWGCIRRLRGQGSP